MIRTSSSGSLRRSGFTLIELLSVIAIITILAALSVGAYFRVRVSQQEHATEVTLTKIQSELDSQMRALFDQCKDDFRNNTIPAGVTNLAGESGVTNRRSLVIWTKLRMKWDFPQSFWEAQSWPATLAQNGSIAMPGSAPLYMKPAYQRALVANNGQPFVAAPPAASPSLANTIRQHQESAVMLYLALTQGRRGNTAFNPNEHIGPQAIAQITLNDANGNPGTFNVFVDSWGNPISFIRWPFGGSWSDLNQLPLAPVNSAGQPVDPQDPERSLQDTDWFSARISAGGPTFSSTFTALLGHPLSTPPANPLNLMPVVFSWGRDGLPGVLPDFSIDPAPGSLPTNEPAGSDSDNVYAYRLKGVGRGNN